MISEKAFDEKDKDLLLKTPLKSEMAVPSEWIVREDAKPDELLTVFVAPATDGSLQAACSCLLGTMDQKCPHALDVFQRVRANDEILVQLMKRRHHAAA